LFFHHTYEKFVVSLHEHVKTDEKESCTVHLICIMAQLETANYSINHYARRITC